MSYPKYKSDLHKIHQSEVYGIHVFRMASKLCRRPTEKAKWLLLCDLEIQTLDRFIHFMQSTRQKHHYPLFWALKGYMDGLILGLLPWTLAMRFLKNGTQSFMVIWLRLKLNASDANGEFFNYIYDHEKAIQDFALVELKAEIRQKGYSTQAVNSLLNNKH